MNLLLTLALVTHSFAAATAFAHTGHHTASDVINGHAHFLLEQDHLFAMIALGLCIMLLSGWALRGLSDGWISATRWAGIGIAAIGAGWLALSPAHAEPGSDMRFSFQPIANSAYGRDKDADIERAPFVIPAGFTQRIVSDENALNLYLGNDRPDMNTVNESGAQAGRFLYRTHEVRGSLAKRVDGGSGAAVSVIDLKTGAARELVGRIDWESLDGLVWTPWQTLLFAEEIIDARLPDPAVPQSRSGLVYELKLNPRDRMSAASIAVRPQLGALSHEGIEIDTRGNVYVIDEQPQGAIYRFVPKRAGDLSQGQLFGLRVKQGAKTGAAEWVALDMTQVQISARDAASAGGATPFCRPEDIERIDAMLYVALTCEDVDDSDSTRGSGAILAVTLSDPPSVRFVVAAGKNVPEEIQPSLLRAGVTGFTQPDNLAHGPDGTLWIAEDNAWSDIWVYDPRSADTNGDGYRDGVRLFASLKDRQGESTGIYFGKHPDTLFVNVQHAGSGNDKTVAITRR